MRKCDQRSGNPIAADAEGAFRVSPPGMGRRGGEIEFVGGWVCAPIAPYFSISDIRSHPSFVNQNTESIFFHFRYQESPTGEILLGSLIFQFHFLNIHNIVSFTILGVAAAGRAAIAERACGRVFPNCPGPRLGPSFCQGTVFMGYHYLDVFFSKVDLMVDKKKGIFLW